MKIKSHALLSKDFASNWYKKWAEELKQNSDHLDGYALHANKFWQNAVICQILDEQGVLRPNAKGIGFGVGNERLPAIFAKNGVNVTATDQDHRTSKAEHWSKAELATGLASLNQFNLCGSKEFAERVSYRPVDMRKLPTSLEHDYDFLWTNCAIGHLGSIDRGLSFIERSLDCLKPGGWAVHTTEVNVLSNVKTVTSGDTVIFRLDDVYGLLKRLTQQGYICFPLNFDMGRSAQDWRLSMRPQFGNDYSKIQVGGHLATQVVLIIHKPVRRTTVSRPVKAIQLDLAHKRALSQLRNALRNPSVVQVMASQKVSTQDIRLTPLKPKLAITIKRGQRRELFLEFKNHSQASLYGIDYGLDGTKPIVLATADPRDRKSDFHDAAWFGGHRNRPSADLCTKNQDGSYVSADHVKPGQEFAFRVVLSTNKMPTGKYQETFSVVQEQAGWIEGSEVELDIKLT